MNNLIQFEPQATYDVTCRTAGCANGGALIRLKADALVPQISCGVCNTQITDITKIN